MLKVASAPESLLFDLPLLNPVVATQQPTLFESVQRTSGRRVPSSDSIIRKKKLKDCQSSLHLFSDKIQSSGTVSVLTRGSPVAEITPVLCDALQEKREVADRVLALEHIRRMRGGTQAQLLRCSDGRYYVVKFPNNPQGLTILASDLLGTLLAIQLGLPTQEPMLVDVRGDLIRYTEDMVIELRHSRVPCQPGLCFGSRYPCNEGRSDDSTFPVVYDFLPNQNMRSVENLLQFAGMLVFDQWTCNTDARQVIFVRQSKGLTYQASMIDQGNCFDGTKWGFPDSPLRGLYSNHSVYMGYRGFDVFEPWLDRLDHAIDGRTLQLAGARIPPEWYEGNVDVLDRLLERLDRRRKRVRGLMWSLLKSSPQCFPNWCDGFNWGSRLIRIADDSRFYFH